MLSVLWPYCQHLDHLKEAIAQHWPTIGNRFSSGQHDLTVEELAAREVENNGFNVDSDKTFIHRGERQYSATESLCISI